MRAAHKAFRVVLPRVEAFRPLAGFSSLPAESLEGLDHKIDNYAAMLHGWAVATQPLGLVLVGKWA